MKIKSLTLIIFLMNIILFSGIALSQQKDIENKVKKTPEERATKRAERMKEKLSLTDTQYKEVYNLILNKNLDKKNNKEKFKSMDKVARKELKKENRKIFNQQLQQILNKEQMEKLKQMKGKHKKGKKNKEKNKTKD